jgi:two-component system NtrC family sensor kinase
LRLSWLLGFGLLLLSSFVPLYFAVSRLAEASMLNVRERGARELGRTIANHVGDASGDASDGFLDAEIDGESVIAIAVYDESGAQRAARGREIESLPDRIDATTETHRFGGSPPTRLLVVSPSSGSRRGAAVLLSIDGARGPAGALVSLMALYTGIIALTLLVFGYILMSRLVVRPTEQLSRAAGRVASGARSLDIPGARTAELDDLGESLRRMTEKLRAEEESLRAKVSELETTTRDLKNAQDTLVRSERLASVGRLAAGLAHEVGNPIAAILGFQELLLTGDLPADETRDFLERMKSETERIHRILRDLLDFARAPGKKSEIGETPGDIAHAVETVVTLVAPQKELKGVEFARDIERGLPMVGLAEEQLVQVLLNLLLNAADAVPKSGGRVSISLRAASKGGVSIAIDDNGPGVAEEIRGTLFEPFVSTKEIGKGTGLGLSVVKGLVDSAGGSISVEKSELGGARFVVELPAYAPPSDPKRKKAPASAKG